MDPTTPNGPPGIEHVDLATVEAARSGAASDKDAITDAALTPPQRAALSLAGGVFCLILLTLAFDYFVYYRSLPPRPQLPSQIDADTVESFRLLAEHYTSLANAAHERAMKMFETCVAAALLPLFAGIVGFIFGREHA